MLLIAMIILILFVFVIYPIGRTRYQKYRVKKDVQKFEKSLVDLQNTVQETIHKYKNTLSVE